MNRFYLKLPEAFKILVLYDRFWLGLYNSFVCSNRRRLHGSDGITFSALPYQLYDFIIIFSCQSYLSDPLSPHVPIVYRSLEVLQATSCIGTELLYIGPSCSSNLCSSVWRCPRECITYDFFLTSPAESHMSASSNLHSFFWWVVGGRTAAALSDVAFSTYSI